jgi:alcohol dehydrogenase class IV
MAFASGGLRGVHALAYPIGAGYRLSHGRSNSIMLPHVMRYNLPGNPEKYAAIAAFMGKEIEGLSSLEAALLLVEAVEEFLEIFHSSFHLRDYKIPKEDIPKLVEGGMKFTRLFTVNPRDMNEGDVRSLYEEAY